MIKAPNVITQLNKCTMDPIPSSVIMKKKRIAHNWGKASLEIASG